MRLSKCLLGFITFWTNSFILMIGLVVFVASLVLISIPVSYMQSYVEEDILKEAIAFFAPYIKKFLLFFLFTAFLLFLSGFFGLCNTCHATCLCSSLYILIQFAVFIYLLSVVMVFFFGKRMMTESIAATLDEKFYSNLTHGNMYIYAHALNRELQCCGSTNYTHLKRTANLNASMVESCCLPERVDECMRNPTDANSNANKGCAEALFLKFKSPYLGYAKFTSVCVLTIFIVITAFNIVYMNCNRNKRIDRNKNNNNHNDNNDKNNFGFGYVI